MSSATQPINGIDIPSDRIYLNYKQVKDAEQDIGGLEKTLADPKSRLEDRSEVTRQLQRIKRDLSSQAPPVATPHQNDDLDRARKDLLQEILVGMPSKMEMRKCPSGAIGKHSKWEKRNKKNIIQYRNIMRILNRDNEDTEVASLELHRPTVSTLNMDDAMIPGTNYFLSPDNEQYKQNYDQTFGQKQEGPTQADVKALLAKIESMEKRLETVAAPKRETQRDRSVLLTAVSSCGKSFKNGAGASAHARHCDDCKTIQAGATSA
jgi:hypothetical protein